jgi:SEC-C motif-containing protein
MSLCPCGSDESYEQCCGPFIKGDKTPTTAEALLRSRYTAYTLKEIDYIYETTHPDQKNQHDQKAAAKWASEAEWHGLNIISVKKGLETDDEGFIEFQVRFREDLETQTHHEMAVFKKVDEKWYFYDGEPVKPETFVREMPKTGRNDPCPCGSGKKFKKCCLQ